MTAILSWFFPSRVARPAAANGVRKPPWWVWVLGGIGVWALLDHSNKRIARAQRLNMRRCANCQGLVHQGVSPCPHCGVDLDWSDDGTQ